MELCVGWLEECRHIGTRFEKLAATFLTMLRMAMIWRDLRGLFRTGV